MTNFTIDYDKSNPRSIEAYSQRLVGKTFRQVIEMDLARKEKREISQSISYDYRSDDVDKRNKGNLGQIIEEYYFHYKCNNDSRADFAEAGVELKVTPFRENSNGSLAAKERLILTMIDYFQVVKEPFESSHLWSKAKLILLIYYLYRKDVRYKIDYQICYSGLFTPPEQDLKIIRHDYNLIVGKIREGKAHELSEADTLYLGAVTKAANSGVRREQPYNKVLAKPRAFAFKVSYMTYVLNAYIIPGKTAYESIMSETEDISFEEYVVNKIDRYRGYSVQELCEEFGLEIEEGRRPKNLEAMLAFRMLGIKGNHAAEFEKANVKVKTIRIGKNNKIRENMSFPAFKFKELVNEEWEDSKFANYLRETRFFFVIYCFDQDDHLRLQGCQFWNIPYEDLEGDVRIVWERTRQVLRDGLQISYMPDGSTRNNFPKASENRVSHVRPHGKNAQDTDELPDGRQYPKQCFWLNNTYIGEQINDKIMIDQ